MFQLPNTKGNICIELNRNTVCSKVVYLAKEKKHKPMILSPNCKEAASFAMSLLEANSITNFLKYSSSNLDLNPKHTTICRNITTSAAPLSDSPSKCSFHISTTATALSTIFLEYSLDSETISAWIRSPHAHLLSVTPDFAALLLRNSSTASNTSRGGSTASAIASAISALSEADSFRFDTTNRSSAEASIFRERDLSVSERSGSGRGGARSSARAASFWSVMRAAAADSRSGMEVWRRWRDWRVSRERDSRDWSFESRSWDLSVTECWSEEKWAERVVKIFVHFARMVCFVSSSSKNWWTFADGVVDNWVAIGECSHSLLKPKSKTLINRSAEE